MIILVLTIQKTLKCRKTRANEVIRQLRDVKKAFSLSMSLSQLWRQEKPYYIKYGMSSFDAGYAGKLGTHQEQ